MSKWQQRGDERTFKTRFPSKPNVSKWPIIPVRWLELNDGICCIGDIRLLQSNGQKGSEVDTRANSTDFARPASTNGQEQPFAEFPANYRSADLADESERQISLICCAATRLAPRSYARQRMTRLQAPE